jgi:spore coat protein U domain-containing protein, fimbrial subunit CupE1/2/3/6
MKWMNWKTLLIAAAAFAFSGTANAQNTQNIDVTAYVPNVCIVDVATTQTTMTFDLSGVATATLPFDATTTLAWRCSAGFNTAISIGPGASGDQENRALYLGALSLPYNLYTDNTFGTIWGDGSGTTATVPIAGTGMANVGTTTVFGRIPLAAAQAATTGIYTDTVLVTLLP